MVGFFTDDAVYIDGPRGTYLGIDAIKAELQSIVQMVPSTTAHVKALGVSGNTVMMERVDVFETQGKSSTWKSQACLKSMTVGGSSVGVITTT
jgi:limonene-1,2-epoxide hydrolase